MHFQKKNVLNLNGSHIFSVFFLNIYELHQLKVQGVVL